jgi:hypothetical protein
MIRRREISAYKAAKKMGFGRPPRTHRPPNSDKPEPIDPVTFAKMLVG